ncbi:hypothetical protein [Bacillus cereus]|uniref:hypothetical protein n=1 Tax=Bacillus cereus TaxID=1396 RepID=UPI000BFB9C1A|nr:hypothetical protein [Bacillus cereus]PGQ52696.1 hypothetical protein COA22_21765 [Bacillus cereus]PGY40682.1 hypothetical protein COE10_19195 [Bacillus cereus]
MNKQDEKLIKAFLYKIENVSETNIELFWILPPLLYSKKTLKKRKDVEDFVVNVLDMKFSNYVYKSRSILVGRVLKNIHNMELEESVKLRNKLIHFFRENVKNSDKNLDKSNSDASFFSDWAEILRKKE